MIEDRALRRVRAELLAEFPVRPAIYWIDLAVSALLAWGGLAAVVAGPLGVSVVAAPIAVIATLRAAYFIHDVHHLRGAVRGFEPAWNLVVGAWVAARTTFERELDLARRELSAVLLADPERSIAEVAAALGFSESSAFARAHRRWTGRAPGAAHRALK